MSQSAPNPFQAPIKKGVECQTQSTNEEVLDFTAIAKKWERYRLIYNGILILETVILSGLGVLLVGLLPLIALAVVAVLGAVAVNFFFLLGPALDGYCQWIFGSRSKTFGRIIFVLGTLFSMLLAAAAVTVITASAYGDTLHELIQV